jgi:hypothetical protein
VLAPPDANAVEVRTLTGIPRVTLADDGSQLVRKFAVVVDDARFAVDMSAALCAQAATIAGALLDAARTTCPTSAPTSTQGFGEYAASVTFKLPHSHAYEPQVDVALRAWQTGHDSTRPRARGMAAEAEFTQPIGRHELIAGYSHPLGLFGEDRWRAAWAGASLTVSETARLHFVYESERDERSGTRDAHYTARLSSALGSGIRATAYLTHAPNDIDRRWSAGLGVEWSF